MKSKKSEKMRLTSLYWFFLAVLLIIIYKTVDSLGQVFTWFEGLFAILMPFIMAIIVAYLFYIPCRSIENKLLKINQKMMRKVARGLSIFIVYVIALILIVVAINFVIPAITTSVKDLISYIPTYINKATEYVTALPTDSIINQIDTQDIIEKISKIDFTQFINVDKIFEYIKGAFGIANVVFDAFVTIVVSIYILQERTKIKAFLSKMVYAFFEEHTAEKIEYYFGKTNRIFFNFISSQIFDAFIVGVVASIALSIMKVKYPVLLGFFIGVFNVIPYFGAIIAVAITILLTIFTGGIGKALIAAVVLIVLQQIDANIINPKILGESLKLSPILVIFSVTFFGAYFGVLGMFLAVPIISIIKILLVDLVEYRLNRPKI